MFTHILMTRFNLATPGRESALRNRPGWLAERFELFERYCLPSVAAQTVPAGRLRWIIYFDKDTPQQFKDRVADLQRQVPFEAYYTGLFPAEGWVRSIAECFVRETPLLLTTRLDNDDALAADFAERLHAAIAEKDNTPGVYNFENGFVIGNGALYALKHPSNPFFSCLTPWSDAPVTAPSIHHMAIARHGPVTQIGGDAAWAQMIHDGNVSNKIRGRRLQPEALGGRFPAGVAGQLSPAGAVTVALENAVLTPLRSARDRLAELRPAKRA